MQFHRDKFDILFLYRPSGMDTGLPLNMRNLKFVILALLASISIQILPVFSQVPTPAAVKTEHPLIGSWIISEPEQGKLFLIVRNTGQVSYFREKWKDGKVLRANWSIQGQGITFDLDSGDKILLFPGEDKNEGFAQIQQAGQSPDEALPKLPSMRLNQDEVGKWHDPSAGEEELSTFLKKSGNVDVFFGTWEVISAKGLPYYIVIEEDRTAATNWPYSKRGVDGMRGFWVRQGTELHIVWDTGNYDILRPFSNKFIKLGYPPAVDLSSIEPAPQPALKVKWYPHEPWRASYEKSRKDKAPIDTRWTSARKAARYFRGNWKLMTSPDVWNKLEMGRFGSAEYSRDGEKLQGTWKNASDYARIHWDNGFTEVIRPVGKHFVTMLYSPLKNLDGIPDRICPVIHEESGTLTETSDKILDKGENLIEKGSKLIKLPKFNLFGRDEE
jgi:hypothetical protein